MRIGTHCAKDYQLADNWRLIFTIARTAGGDWPAAGGSLKAERSVSNVGLWTLDLDSAKMLTLLTFVLTFRLLENPMFTRVVNHVNLQGLFSRAASGGKT